MLNFDDLSRLKGYRFPRTVIGYAVWAYHRFALSLRDVEDLQRWRRLTDGERARLKIRSKDALGGGSGSMPPRDGEH